MTRLRVAVGMLALGAILLGPGRALGEEAAPGEKAQPERNKAGRLLNQLVEAVLRTGGADVLGRLTAAKTIEDLQEALADSAEVVSAVSGSARKSLITPAWVQLEGPGCVGQWHRLRSATASADLSQGIVRFSFVAPLFMQGGPTKVSAELDLLQLTAPEGGSPTDSYTTLEIAQQPAIVIEGSYSLESPTPEWAGDMTSLSRVHVAYELQIVPQDANGPLQPDQVYVLRVRSLPWWPAGGLVEGLAEGVTAASGRHDQ